MHGGTQVEATLSSQEDQAELASGLWTDGNLADADIIIIEEGAAHKLLEKYPEKKFIVVQQPAHATLAATMEAFGTCVFRERAHSRVCDDFRNWGSAGGESVRLK